MNKLENLQRLHLVNTLFARVTGQDLYLAEQIKAAITTSLTEVEGRPPADPAFTAAAARLLEKVLDGEPGHGFHHWDATETPVSPTPLFTRAGIIAALKSLAPFKEATLLVTNLRAAHAPAGRRWSPRRQRDYDESLAFIRDLAAHRTRESANLNLFFL